MRRFRLLPAVFALGFISAPALASQAQPVPVAEDQSLTPQIEISGVGAATVKNSEVNFSDSALLIGAAQALSEVSGIGSTGLGWLTLDETNEGLGTQLFLNQAFLDFQSERFEVLIGRTDNPTAHIVDFPTIRGDDLVTLTNPLNPFSNGKNAEEHRYSNVASVTMNQGLKTFESIHAQHLINSAGIGRESELNSFGATFEYLSPPGMEAFETIPAFGFGYEHYSIRSGGSDGLHSIYAGGILNLNRSVTNRWDFRVQDTAVFGSGLRNFSTITDSFQADSNTITGSLRYLHSPFGGTGYQVALTAAYQSYFKVSEARSYGAALTGVKRLGKGFELVAQYLGQERSSALAAVQSPKSRYEQSFEVGFVFSFNATINQHLSPRRSLLNQSHEYVPN